MRLTTIRNWPKRTIFASYELGLKGSSVFHVDCPRFETVSKFREVKGKKSKLTFERGQAYSNKNPLI